MSIGPSAYMVVRREDGFGDVYPLAPGHRYLMGRSPSCRIVLKDDMCSREHAEIFLIGGQWQLRDLGSLNGTRVNGRPLKADWPLAPHDEVTLGRSEFVFVEDMAQLPGLPGSMSKEAAEQIEIKKRLSNTRYLAPTTELPALTPEMVRQATTQGGQTLLAPAGSAATASHERALALLYRLALDMGATDDRESLVKVVLDGLLEAIPAEVGAVLAVKEASRDLELLAYRHRNPEARTYHKVSQYVSTEVLESKEAVLATNVAADRYLKNRESLAELHVASLICAPVLFDENCLGLIHLYSTAGQPPLDSESLEFAVAVARQLGVAMHHLRRQETLSAENQELRQQLHLESELVGSSTPLRAIEQQIARVAETNATVLVRGESGSGKELVARAIHHNSKRKDGPFICLNCAALTETLLESELFGHEKGAFTGATERMAGKFESADGGSIFLDEIGEMVLGTQAKLLRVLEGHPFERVGGNTPIRVDVRVIAATNRPLEEAVREGGFRRDLFYRLQVVEIQVPPLRERLDDVPALAEHFLKRFAREMGRKLTGFTPAAITRLRNHDWPGNVRELRNTIERSVALSSGPTLDASDIWLSSLNLDGPSTDAPARYEALSLEEVEKKHIAATLTHTDWNKSQAAAILGIERSTLDRKIKGYGLSR